MNPHKMKNTIVPLLFCIFVLMTLACRLISISNLTPSSPTITETPPNPLPTFVPTLASFPAPHIILQRLELSFLGLDGNKLIGSGCPGNDGKGTIVDYHFSVSGVDVYRQVTRVVVAGDNSTITWASPCSDSWELAAFDAGNGNWDILSRHQKLHIYT